MFVLRFLYMHEVATKLLTKRGKFKVNNKIKMLEKIGQTKSIHQYDSVNQMIETLHKDDQAFSQLKIQSGDLVCVLFPNDDDE